MSHDRGCPCGRERCEYADCTRPDCTRAAQQRNQERYRQLTTGRPTSRHVQHVADQIVNLTRLERLELVSLLENRSAR